MDIRFLIALLGTAGLAISAAFTVIYYGNSSAAGFVTTLCRIEKASCSTVLNAPDAKLFGLPNFLFGILYYLTVIGIALFTSIEDLGLPYWVLVALTMFTVGVGVYLIYSLMFRIRIPCPLCYASHGINLAILLLLIIHAVA